MVRGNRVLAGFVLAMLVGATLSGAAAIADEGAQPNEVAEEDAVLQLVEAEGADNGLQIEAPEEDTDLQLVEAEGDEGETSPPVEETLETGPTEDTGDVESAALPDARPRPAPRGESAGRTAAAGAILSAQPGQDGQGQVEIDPESAAGMCPGTALKIDNLRSNGTFGPITISNYTNTSFTWTSTEAVSAVLVKDGGGHKTNPGGSSGSASTFGQDISHVIFCLGADVPEVDAEAPCDDDETTSAPACVEPPCDDDEMTSAPACEVPPCDDDEMTSAPACEMPPCDDDQMTSAPACEEPPAPCDDDETKSGAQPCTPAPCDGDKKMPGRQDCNEVEDVAGVESDEKPDDDDVQGAGLVADSEPDATPRAAQPMAAQPAVQGSVLPFTGGQVLPLLMVAMGFVTAGGGAILIRRP